jgi:hypothetical protein
MKHILFFLASIFILFSCQQNEKKRKIVVEEITLKSIDIYPQYSGCESFYDKASQLTCLQEKISNFIDYSIQKKYKNDLLELQDSIWVELAIDTIGNTHFIRLIHSDDKAVNKAKFRHIFKQISQKIPMINPAVYHDKPVNFQFKIPIVIKH